MRVALRCSALLIVEPHWDSGGEGKWQRRKRCGIAHAWAGVMLSHRQRHLVAPGYSSDPGPQVSQRSAQKREGTLESPVVGCMGGALHIGSETLETPFSEGISHSFYS